MGAVPRHPSGRIQHRPEGAGGQFAPRGCKPDCVPAWRCGGVVSGQPASVVAVSGPSAADKAKLDAMKAQIVPG